MILTANITLPDDTASVGNVLVYVYTEDDIGGRLFSHPVNTSGTTQASPEAQMVRKFKLETANVTLASQLTKNSTTNRFKVRAVFKIALSSSTLYLQSLMIRKILFVVTSYGKDDHQNEKLYLIFYSKSAPPSAPRNLKTQTVFDDAAIYIKLKWDPPSTDGGTEIKRYVIQYVAKGLSWKSPNEAETTSTEYGDLRLPNGKYSARVRAQNKAGLGPPSNEVIIDLETTLLVRPTSPSGDINILLSSLTTSGTGNRYEAIISVPIVVLAVLIALLSWCYCKRSRRQSDPENIAVQLDFSESTV
ncbi:uncharacterized protein [Pocillopora verrucosa]|uniref:uncharacterized protein isoform X2 n=1 Tax=Pocillopora verrucosa TaxID=203993 RepID=UPI003341E016